MLQLLGRRSSKTCEIEVYDLRQVLAEDAVEVAVKSGCVDDGAVDLLLAFGPDSVHRSTLAVEVVSHADEGFDDALDALAEFGAR